MVNKDGSKPLIEYTCTPETLTEEMFKNLDKDSDGQLSFPVSREINTVFNYFFIGIC